MATDIYQKIVEDFGENTEKAREILQNLYCRTKGGLGEDKDRMLVYLANGDLDKLKKMSESTYLKVVSDHKEKIKDIDFFKTFHELKLMKKHRKKLLHKD